VACESARDRGASHEPFLLGSDMATVHAQTNSIFGRRGSATQLLRPKCQGSSRSVAPKGTPPPPPTKFAVFHRQIVKNRLIELRPFRSNFSPTTVQHSEKNGSRCETVQLCSTAQNTDTGCETVKLWSQLKQAPKASISTRSDWPHRRGPHGQVHVRGVAHRRWLTSLPANRLLQTEHSPPSVNETAPSCVV